jgi:hypothetical protein
VRSIARVLDRHPAPAFAGELLMSRAAIALIHRAVVRFVGPSREEL